MKPKTSKSDFKSDQQAAPYHKYVFNEKAREFVGVFEAMYRAEEKEGFDSWNQNDLTHITKQLAMTLLKKCSNIETIADIGCGKGYFTESIAHIFHPMLMRAIDISPTAIEKAKERVKFLDYRIVEYSVMDISKATKNEFCSRLIGDLQTFLHLTVCMEVLSYLPNWREVIENISCMAMRVLITLSLPPNPIGYVKSFDELEAEVKKHFIIKHKIMYNDNLIILMAKIKKS